MWAGGVGGERLGVAWGDGGRDRGRGGGGFSRSYAVSTSADRDASQLYYWCLIISVGGRGGWGAYGGCMEGGGGLY